MLELHFNTGLIVQCIPVSNNPQTHYQVLLLLSLAAQLCPSHVLHNIMAIFTFLGTFVLRQDDAYSFQVIAKTLESVIPTLIEASMNTAVEPVVTTVISMFADALPEVPEHRRIAIFDKLLTTLDPEIHLWLAPTLIPSNMASAQGGSCRQGARPARRGILCERLPLVQAAGSAQRLRPHLGVLAFVADRKRRTTSCHIFRGQGSHRRLGAVCVGRNYDAPALPLETAAR